MTRGAKMAYLRPMRLARSVWWGVLAALSVGCAVDAGDPIEVGRSAVATTPRCRETVLPWGSGPGQIGMIAAGPERLARSAPAIAVAPGGALLVLDAVNHRLVEVAADGSTRTRIADLPEAVDTLAVGDDGAVAVFSPARTTAWLYDRSGDPAGSLTLSPTLHHLVGLSIGPSHQLRFANAYQETFTAGSPALPLDLASTLRSTVEGAVVLDDGRGLAVEVTGDQAELIVIDNAHPVDGKPPRGPRFAIPGPATAAQIVGLAGNSVCLRVETLDPQRSEVAVERRAVCLDLHSGAPVYDAALPAPAAFRPRHELTAGGVPPRIAWMEPRTDGLAVASCEVSR